LKNKLADQTIEERDSPMINISNNLKCTGLSVELQKIFTNPHYQVILERPFDYLVKEVWG